MSNQTYQVTGMTCEHCVSAVTDELQAVAGVRDVAVTLVAGGASTVTVESERELSSDEVATALDEAGDYSLA